jgi:hypothetical protein
LLPRYRQLYARGAYVPTDYRDWLRARVDPLLERHGFGRPAGHRAAAGVPGDPESGFPAGSLPRLRPATADPVQPTLL